MELNNLVVMSLALLSLVGCASAPAPVAKSSCARPAETSASLQLMAQQNEAILRKLNAHEGYLTAGPQVVEAINLLTKRQGEMRCELRQIATFQQCMAFLFSEADSEEFGGQMDLCLRKNKYKNSSECSTRPEWVK